MTGRNVITPISLVDANSFWHLGLARVCRVSLGCGLWVRLAYEWF